MLIKLQNWPEYEILNRKEVLDEIFSIKKVSTREEEHELLMSMFSNMRAQNIMLSGARRDKDGNMPSPEAIADYKKAWDGFYSTLLTMECIVDGGNVSHRA